MAMFMLAKQRYCGRLNLYLMWTTCDLSFEFSRADEALRQAPKCSKYKILLENLSFVALNMSTPKEGSRVY